MCIREKSLHALLCRRSETRVALCLTWAVTEETRDYLALCLCPRPSSWEVLQLRWEVTYLRNHVGEKDSSYLWKSISLNYSYYFVSTQFACNFSACIEFAAFNRAHSEEHRMPQCNVVKRPFQFEEWTRNSTAQSFSWLIIWMDLTKLLKKTKDIQLVYNFSFKSLLKRQHFSETNEGLQWRPLSPLTISVPTVLMSHVVPLIFLWFFNFN